jgi:hypothetical protein
MFQLPFAYERYASRINPAAPFTLALLPHRVTGDR